MHGTFLQWMASRWMASRYAGGLKTARLFGRWVVSREECMYPFRLSMLYVVP